MQELQSRSSKPGIISWIGVRPHRSADLVSLKEVHALENKGLQGDHYSNLGGPRQVTLIQAEHLRSIASFLGVDSVSPNLTRRNLVVSGFNLLSLKGQEFFIGECRLKYTGDCHPCSRMEKNLGPGGYHSMRGLGGITATVIKGGKIRIGDSLQVAGQKIS